MNPTPENQTKVRRFHMTIMEGRGVIPVEHEIGEWVKHCEHAAKLATLEAERAAERKACDHLIYTQQQEAKRWLSSDRKQTEQIKALSAEVQKLMEALAHISSPRCDAERTDLIRLARAALNSTAGEKD